MSNNLPTDVLPGSKVRLRRASLILYIMNVAGAAFSFFFITILTRKLSIEDYAVWIMILRYIGYVSVPSVIFSYWITRDISRGKNTSRTGLFFSVAMGAASVPIYLALIYLFSTGFDQPIIPLALSSLALFMDYITSALASTSSGYKPEIMGYGSFVMKAGQALSGFVLLGVIASGLVGAIIALLIGKVLMNLTYLAMNRTVLGESKFDGGVIRSWLRASWLPLFGSVAGMLYTLDVLVVNLTYGSEVPIAYYGMAISVIGVITYAIVVSSSFYPKVLCKRNLEDLEEALWLTLLLSVPTVGIIITYASPVSAIFGLKYLPAAFGLQVISLAAITQMIFVLASTAYTGLEGADQGSLSSRNLYKSAIFKNGAVVFTINAIYVAALSLLSSLGLDPATFVAGWGALLTLAYLSGFLAFRQLIWRDFRQSFSLSMVLRNLAILALPLIPALFPYLILGVQISETFNTMFLNIVGPVLLSFALYFGTLYLIERRFRKLLGDILRKVLSRDWA